MVLGPVIGNILTAAENHDLSLLQLCCSCCLKLFHTFTNSAELKEKVWYTEVAAVHFDLNAGEERTGVPFVPM